MERLEFKCALTHEQVLRQKKTDSFISRFVLPMSCVLLFGVLIFMVHLAYTELSSAPDWQKSEFLIPIVVSMLAALMILCLSVYLIRVTVEMIHMSETVYELFETKTFAWDPKTNEFFYTDKDRKLRFKGDDVDKWVSVNNKGNTTDIMRLRNGEQFVLEGKFNPNIYPYLHENRIIMRLPEPKFLTWTINCYKDPI